MALGAAGAWVDDGPLFEIREAGESPGFLAFLSDLGSDVVSGACVRVGSGDGQWPG